MVSRRLGSSQAELFLLDCEVRLKLGSAVVEGPSECRRIRGEYGRKTSCNVRPEELNLLLMRRFPALIDGYLSVKRLWGGDEPGPHIVYGDVFVPFIRTALAEEQDFVG